VATKIQFGVYELDLDAMELRKHGVRIRLQDQPFRVLARLIEQPGEIVTREQLKERIWADDTFVDFDQSLNKAVNRLRESLNDDAAQPRYIETVPRRGYRFIAPVSGRVPASPPPVPSPAATPRTGLRTRSWAIAIIATAGICLVAYIAAFSIRKPKTPAPQRATVRITTDGNSMQPALSRDGKMLAYTSIGNDGVGHIWVRQTGGRRGPPDHQGCWRRIRAQFFARRDEHRIPLRNRGRRCLLLYRRLGASRNCSRRVLSSPVFRPTANSFGAGKEVI
jgi:DNA-binding winged helix-turn-helix (wHTH) protein